MIISIDHGNKQIKLPSGKVFTSGINESETRPPFGDDVLKYRGKYYTISEKRIPFMRDKTTDNRFYILTLFAIAFELEKTGNYNTGLTPIELLVGLPPAHFGGQYKKFEKYFKRVDIEDFEFHGKKFYVKISEVSAYPQAFAAAMSVYGMIRSLPRVVVLDIGGFTADYLLIKNGQADLSVCDSLENGIIILYNQIISKVNSEMDILLDESDVDAILKGTPYGFNGNILRVVDELAQTFISDLLSKLRERSIDLRSGRTVFVGGGSLLLRKQIELSSKISSPIFIDEIFANAKGYELLYKATQAKG